MRNRSMSRHGFGHVREIRRTDRSVWPRRRVFQRWLRRLPKSKAKPPASTSCSRSRRPRKPGENQFEVMVKGADGKPISDADVSSLLVMPTSRHEMAEMRNDVNLKPSGNRDVHGCWQRDDGRQVEYHGQREAGRERNRSKETHTHGEVTSDGRRATERLS